MNLAPFEAWIPADLAMVGLMSEGWRIIIGDRFALGFAKGLATRGWGPFDLFWVALLSTARQLGELVDRQSAVQVTMKCEAHFR